TGVSGGKVPGAGTVYAPPASASTHSHGAHSGSPGASGSMSKPLYGSQQPQGAGAGGTGVPGSMGGMQQGAIFFHSTHGQVQQQQQQGYAPGPPGMPGQVGYQAYNPSGQQFNNMYYQQQAGVPPNPYAYGYAPQQYPPAASQYQGGGGQRFPNMPRGYPGAEFGGQGMGNMYGQMDYSSGSQYGQDQFGMQPQMGAQSGAGTGSGASSSGGTGSDKSSAGPLGGGGGMYSHSAGHGQGSSQTPTMYGGGQGSV
ncbi:unnamed protein product, partial [Discosporangium mesarthrocarpum]